jgi:hypothetical protein
MARMDWQPDMVRVECEHGTTLAQAEPGDERATLEARAIADHLAVACECWRQMVNVGNVQALHALLVSMGARCGGRP